MATCEVQLAIYDLSQGMARGLSAQFLGPAHAIEIIPHTGIVVFGREYFFGGGIQAAEPNEFRRSHQMFPIEVQSLGTTSVSKEQFEEWCCTAMRTGEYSAAAYDLMNRNCNNFSHDAALQGLGLSRGVPDWILQVPQRFLASPMGQMVRPMLENMQVTNGGGSSVAPFSTASTASSVAASPAAATPSAEVNPWANIPAESSIPKNNDTTDAATTTPTTALSTPVLDSHDRPLLSNDTQVVGVCVSKLKKCLVDDEKAASSLDELSKSLAKGATLPDQLVENSCEILLQIMKSGGADVVFALMLSRLVVLHPPKTTDSESNYGQCMAWVMENIQHGDGLSVPARSMAWCTLSNAYKARPSSVSSIDGVVEAAMMDLNPESHPRTEVRQSAAAFLYNVSHEQSPLADHSSEELPDLLVSLLWGSLDGIDTETDPTTRLRRLLVAGRIIRPGGDSDVINVAAKSLVVDLGFTDAIAGLADKGASNSGGDAENAKRLAVELQSLVEN